jgi:hypothetical protein
VKIPKASTHFINQGNILRAGTIAGADRTMPISW